MSRWCAALAVVLATGPAWADLSAARAQPNLERRARMALDNAEQCAAAARQAYRNGNIQQAQAALEETAESVLLAHESLKQTGKNPARSPRHFKNAEIKTRGLLRRLDDFRQEMSVDDRDTLDRVRAAIDQVQRELLAGIMGGKKK